jgi:NAD(P)-dependent dehydrogenase (short-subunit alcohol dehydrogenase family)
MPIEKVALITGASRGIGRGIAEALAAHGWNIGINYRSDQHSAEETKAAVAAKGGTGFCVPADIGQIAEHESLVQAVMDHYGRIDLLVNNAGMAPRTRMDMLVVTQESYDEVMRTNLKGPFFLTQRVAQKMIALIESKTIDAPQIINIGSISGSASSPNRAEYCISKAGLTMTTHLWAHRLAEYGINVYEIRPGIIETDMTANVKEKYDRLILQEGLTLLPRWGKSEDVGKAVAAIAEGMFPYSTGEIINVDGGFNVSRL